MFIFLNFSLSCQRKVAKEMRFAATQIVAKN